MLVNFFDYLRVSVSLLYFDTMGYAIKTIDYLLSKSLSSQHAKQELAKLLQIFDIAPVTHVVLESALKLKFKDYEYAVIHEPDKMIGVKAIVMRDRKGFAPASLSIYSPDELLTVINKL